MTRDVSEEDVKLPSLRNLVTVFGSMTFQQCSNTDDTLSYIRRRLKWPLILLTFGAGLLGSLSMSFLKGMTVAFREVGLWGGVTLYIYLILAVTLALKQLSFLNQMMEVYDQIEIVPIYQSSIIMMNICAGAIIMNEKQFYSWGELLGIFASGMVSIVGVVIIIRKPSSIKEKTSPVDSNSATLSVETSNDQELQKGEVKVSTTPTGIMSQMNFNQEAVVRSRQQRQQQSGLMDYLVGGRECMCSLDQFNIDITVERFDKKPVEDQEEIGTLVN
jgi:hypothetical protein